MSLMAAIDTAVRLQLVREKRTDPTNYDLLMGGTLAAGGNPATGYGYTEDSLLRFLEQVSVRLRIDQPPLNFDWSRARPSDCLAASLLTLIGLIARDTVPVATERKA